MTGVGQVQVSTTTVQVIDPTDGTSLDSVTFTFPANVYLGGGMFQPDAQAAYLVSDDLRYVVAYQLENDGTEQTGVLTRDGTFINVSGVLSQGGSFSGALTSNNARIVGDTFYFDLGTKQTGVNGHPPDDKVYSVPLSAATSGTVGAMDITKVTVRDAANLDSTSFTVSPNGSVGADQCEVAGGRFAYTPQALIGTSDYLTLNTASGGLRRWHLAASCTSAQNDVTQNTGTVVLPETTRTISQAVVSPDGTQIALITTADSGGSFTLYTVPTKGGSPAFGVDLPGGGTVVGWI